MADKDQSQSETGEEMEDGLKLPSVRNYEEVNEMFSKLDLISTEAQVIEIAMSCSDTMLTFAEQVTLLMVAVDISTSLTSQSYDQSQVKQTGENDNKQLAEKDSQLPNLVDEYGQQISQTFADQLRSLQPCVSEYQIHFDKLLDESSDIWSSMNTSCADHTAENINKKLALLCEKHEYFIKHMIDLNEKILDAIGKAKAEIKAKVEEFKIAKELEATNQVRAHKFENDVKQVETGKDKRESELQKQFSKILSILSDMKANLLKCKQLTEEY